MEVKGTGLFYYLAKQCLRIPRLFPDHKTKQSKFYFIVTIICTGIKFPRKCWVFYFVKR